VLEKLFLYKPFRLQPILDIMSFIATTAFKEVVRLPSDTGVVF
jgi:hypothetical protein